MNGSAIRTAPDAGHGQPVLEAEEIAVHFPLHQGLRSRATVRAVDGVSFTIDSGETLALVGESGSGKSTTGRAVLQLERLVTGSIRFAGQPLNSLSRAALRDQRRRLQMVFQDPYGSLNPRHKVRTIVSEPLHIHDVGDGDQRRRRVAELLELVGLPQEFAERHPHELSGGQRQRVAIARALAPEPHLVVCDEPVSSLDVSIQAQIVNLFVDLQDELQVAYLFIAHDLAVVRRIAHRIAVMYLGKIVETAPAEQFYTSPRHPYSLALLSAVPIPDARIERQRQRILLRGDIPSPTAPPSGCRFRTRCPWSQPLCAEEEPPLRPTSGGGLAACHFLESIDPDAATSSPLSPVRPRTSAPTPHPAQPRR